MASKTPRLPRGSSWPSAHRSAEDVPTVVLREAQGGGLSAPRPRSPGRRGPRQPDWVGCDPGRPRREAARPPSACTPARPEVRTPVPCTPRTGAAPRTGPARAPGAPGQGGGPASPGEGRPIPPRERPRVERSGLPAAVPAPLRRSGGSTGPRRGEAGGPIGERGGRRSGPATCRRAALRGPGRLRGHGLRLGALRLVRHLQLHGRARTGRRAGGRGCTRAAAAAAEQQPPPAGGRREGAGGGAGAGRGWGLRAPAHSTRAAGRGSGRACVRPRASSAPKRPGGGRAAPRASLRLEPG